MDQNLWQTTESLDILTSITQVSTNSIAMWGNTAKHCSLGLFQDSDIAGDLEDSKSTSGGTLCVFGSQAALLCGTTMQNRIISRFWFWRRPWRRKINVTWSLMQFRKSNICANKLDVQETDISLTQLDGSWTFFSGCRFTHGLNSRASSLGLCNWSISLSTKINKSTGHVDRYTSHVIFLMQFTPRNWYEYSLHGSSVCMRATFHIHVIHDERLIVRSLLLLRSVFLCVSLRRLPLPSTLYLQSDLNSLFHVDSAEGTNRCAFAWWGVLHPGDIPSSHRLWAQRPWWLPPLRE